MKPQDYRKTIAELKRLCRKRGIVVDINEGKGSHHAVTFTDLKTGETVDITLVKGRWITANVLRNVLRFLIDFASNPHFPDAVRNLAAAIYEIIKSIIGGS